MARTWRSGGKKNGSASSRKRFKDTSNSALVSWSNLDHDMLFIILMKLGLVEFFSFSGVCKSWRSCALSNKETFMMSRDPMPLSIPPYSKKVFFLYELFGQRRFKTIVPRFSGRVCVGLASGYLILFGRKTKDFCLVNLVTRRELRFPALASTFYQPSFRAILVFSPSLSEYVLVFILRSSNRISFASSGEASWHHLFFTFGIIDLHAVDGRIYVLNNRGDLGEMRLHPEPRLMLLKVKKVPDMPFRNQELLSASKKLYLVDFVDPASRVALVLDIEKLEWVSIGEALTKEYALFLSKSKCCALVDPKKWATPEKHRENMFYFTGRSFAYPASYFFRWTPETPGSHESASFHFLMIDGGRPNMWYFPHECYQENRLLE